MRLTGCFIAIAAISLPVLQGCTADTTPESAPASASAAPSGASEGTLLASVTKQGSTVKFSEVEPGQLVVYESRTSEGSVLSAIHGGTPLDAFRILSDGAEPPTALVEAEARRVALNASAPKVAPSAPAIAPSKDLLKIVPLTTSGQGGFESSICSSTYPLAPYRDSCQVGTGYLAAPTEYSAYIQGQGYNDPTSTSNAILFYNQYNTSTNSYTIPWSCSVAPGGYAYFLFYGGADYRYASILGGTLGLAEFAWTPSLEIGAAGATGASAWLSGFPDDTTASIFISGPDLPNGMYVGPAPTGGGNVALVQGQANDVSLLWNCYGVHSQHYTYTISATGTKTGAYASTQATLLDCWNN